MMQQTEYKTAFLLINELESRRLFIESIICDDGINLLFWGNFLAIMVK